jgi:integrase
MRRNGMTKRMATYRLNHLGGARRRVDEAGKLPCAASFLCDAFDRSRLRHYLNATPNVSRRTARTGSALVCTKSHAVLFMSIRVVLPDEVQLVAAGYAAVAHVPFLVGADGSYLSLANRYVRARSLCEWPLRLGTNGEPTRQRRKFQTRASCIALARRLREFLAWVKSQGDRSVLDVTSMSYDDVCDWQDGLANGACSTSGRPLSNGTINLYVAEACYFLTWLSLVPKNPDGTAFRAPFLVVTRERLIATHDGKRAHRSFVSIDVRVGHLDVVPERELILPTPNELTAWLGGLRLGTPVKALMAETIVSSGMRISEVNSMEVHTLPARRQWRVVAGRVFFFIDLGVKGRKTSPTSSVAVRGRTVSLPIEVAEKIEAYRSGPRELQVRRWIRDAKTKQEQARRASLKPSRLWLSEFSNKPFANQQLRRVWSRGAEHIPGWSPHQGRKYYSVEWLVSSARLQASAVRGPVDLGWIDQILRNQIDTFLRPTLGHLSIDTTNLYIRAAIWRLQDVLGLPGIQYQDAQDGHCAATEALAEAPC